MIGIGSTVGNYRVIKKLGSGAMGSVYLAEHPMIGKKVALKVIHSDLAENEEMVSRFFNEARAVTKIGHEHIVEVIDFGQTPEGDNFIVMELLEGVSLGDLLKEKTILPVADALSIAAQIADGLAASHAQGIVHRDMKPDNVYLVERLGRNGFVKILDFGLAKLTQGGGAMSHKTRAGSVLGTPHYMAPEQCEGKPDIDHRVDVYALGCILYQALCGRVPFPGEGFGEVLVKHLREPPVVPTKINSTIPRAVEAVILHALAKRKEFRFQSMAEMARALRDPDKWARDLDGESLLRGSGEMTPPMPRPAVAATVAVQAPVEEPRAPVVKTDDVAPTMLDRVVPGEVGAALASRGPPPPIAPTPGSGVATVMLEAPSLPPIRSTNPTLETEMSMVPAPSHAARRFAVIAGAASLLIILAAVVARVTSKPEGEGQATVAPSGSAAPPTRTVPAPTAPTVPAGGTPAEPIAVVIQTVPAGAQVLRGDQPVGSTPMVLKVPAGTHSLSLTLRKEGFSDETRELAPDTDPQLSVTLRAVPRPAPPPPTERPAARKSGGSGGASGGERKSRPKQPSTGGDDILVPSF